MCFLFLCISDFDIGEVSDALILLSLWYEGPGNKMQFPVTVSRTHTGFVWDGDVLNRYKDAAREDGGVRESRDVLFNVATFCPSSRVVIRKQDHEKLFRSRAALIQHS
jgi:hypothetical protein